MGNLFLTPGDIKPRYDAGSVARGGTNEASITEQLAISVRGVKLEFNVYEEILTLRSVHCSFKGAAKAFFSIATDGALSMLGQQQDF